MICVQGANERKCPCVTFFLVPLCNQRLMAVLVSVSEDFWVTREGGGGGRAEGDIHRFVHS